MDGQIVYFGCVAALAIGVLWRPSIALTAMMLIFALKQWGTAKVASVAGDALFTNLVIGAIVGLALVRSFFEKGRLKSPIVGDLTLWTFLLYGYAVITFMWTSAPERALDELKTNLPYVMIALGVMPMIIRSMDNVKTGLTALIVLGTPLMAAFVFLVTWEYRAIASEVDAGETVRFPLSLAQFAASVFVAGVMLLSGKAWKYVLLAGIAALAFTMAIRTGSRGQFIAMVIAAGLFLPISRGQRSSLKVIGALAICAGIGLAAFNLYGDSVGGETGDTRWSSTEMSEDYEGRIERSMRLLDFWASDPWYIVFGIGTSGSSASNMGGSYAHILAVDVLSEYGLIGFTLLLVLLWRCAAVIFEALRSVSRDPGQMGRNPAIAAMIAIFAMDLLLAFKQGTLLRNSYLFMFPVMIQGILAHERLARFAQVDRSAIPPLSPLGRPAEEPTWRAPG